MNESQIEQLGELPQRPDAYWQGGLVRLPTWINGEDQEPFRPYLPLWVSVPDGKVHTGRMLHPNDRDPAAVVDALVEFALQSDFGGYRPSRVQVADAVLAEQLASLAAVGVEVCLVEQLDIVQQLIDDMFAEERGGFRPLPSPLDGEGVTPERMRRFAEAAAAFYRAAPWQYLTDVDLVQIEKPKAPPGMQFVVVLGAGGEVYGLGLYRNMEDYVRFRRGEARDSRRMPGLWQVSFDPAVEAPPRDVDLWEDHNLPLASDRAHPTAIWVGPRGEVKRPTAKELAFLEAVLWAFAQTGEAEIDSGRWQKEVQTSDTQAAFTFAIPDLLKPPTFEEWIQRGFEPDRRSHERMFADMDRYFQEHPPADASQMQETMARLFAGKKIDELVTQPETPAEKAQELCFEAFSTHGRRRVQLARQALEVCADCADAYVILAEQAGTLEAKLDHYAKGVAAGERALGPQPFEEHGGHFWGVSSTRPYMRARLGLALCLDEAGRSDEAVDHFQEMLRLNPNDNQGVRYLLMPKLMQSGRDAEAARLLKDFREESANWAYARALLAFRLSGRSAATRRELREAFRTNPHVPQLLLEDELPPTPPHYSPGSPEEAVICCEELGPALAETEGALDWLLAEYRQRQRETEARRRQQRREDRGQRKKRKRR